MWGELHQILGNDPRHQRCETRYMSITKEIKDLVEGKPMCGPVSGNPLEDGNMAVEDMVPARCVVVALVPAVEEKNTTEKAKVGGCREHGMEPAGMTDVGGGPMEANPTDGSPSVAAPEGANVRGGLEHGMAPAGETDGGGSPMEANPTVGSPNVAATEGADVGGCMEHGKAPSGVAAGGGSPMEANPKDGSLSVAATEGGPAPMVPEPKKDGMDWLMDGIRKKKVVLVEPKENEGPIRRRRGKAKRRLEDKIPTRGKILNYFTKMQVPVYLSIFGIILTST